MRNLRDIPEVDRDGTYRPSDQSLSKTSAMVSVAYRKWCERRALAPTSGEFEKKRFRNNLKKIDDATEQKRAGRKRR